MRNLAIIPARGGSKRIPRKNIRDFLGKPIIAYSIETALESGLFEEVMVSTDNEEIATVAKNYGAVVPFLRSEETASDYASTVEVLIEVLESYEKFGEVFKYGCCIYPTAPLLKMECLENGLKILKKESFNIVLPVVEYTYPIQRSLNLSQNGKISMKWPEYLNSRSQDLSSSYHDAGQFYWFTVESLRNEKSLFSINSGAMVLPSLHVQDIDTEEDWKLAELKFKLMRNEI